MQTSIELTGRRPGSERSLTKFYQSVINRISRTSERLTERALLRVSMTAVAVLIIFAGRYSATEATADAVMVAVSSLTALIALAKADSINSGNKYEVSK